MIPADPEALGAVFSAQAEALASQVLVTFELPPGVAGEQTVETSLTAGGNTFTDSAFVSLTRSDVGRRRTAGRSKPGQRRSSVATGFLLGALALGLGLAGVLAFALGGGSQRSRCSDQRARQLLRAGRQTRADVGGRRGHAKAQAASRTPPSTWPVRWCKGDFEDRLAKRLAGAGSSLKPAEWLLLHAAHRPRRRLRRAASSRAARSW